MFPLHFCKIDGTMRKHSGADAKAKERDDPARIETVRRIAAALESSPSIALQVLEQMTPNTRRHLLVVAATREWYGSDQVRKQLDAADTDQDTKISSADFDRWIEGVMIARQKINFKTLVLVALHAGLPFVAFGFLDNSTMILAGDAIDELFGGPLGLSVMGAAALGGVVSGGLGIQIHGLAQRAVQRLTFLPQPQLHPSLRLHRDVFRADHIGGSIGIFLGLLLGMTPLLFVEAKVRL
jgi:hypothetical protein